MERREFLGSVEETTLSANVSNVDTTISLTSGSTFPTGASSPFVIVLSRGSINEEKVLCSSRTGDTITVLERGYDGTSAQAHDSGDYVDHVLDATVVQDMNTTTYDNYVLSWMGV